MFHVNKLKRTLHPQENVVFPNVLVKLIEPLFAMHELEKILKFKEKHTRCYLDKEGLVKWKDCE